MQKNQIIIIGAGPAGLMAAQILAEKGFEVHVYEQNKAASKLCLRLAATHGTCGFANGCPVNCNTVLSCYSNIFKIKCTFKTSNISKLQKSAMAKAPAKPPSVPATLMPPDNPGGTGLKRTMS